MPADLPKETWDLRKTDTGWAYVRTSSPVLPATQAPADDMPPIALMVLDSLADGDETIDTMRNCGEVEPYGLALVGEKFIFDALRSLLAGGLVEAIEIVEADDGLGASSRRRARDRRRPPAHLLVWDDRSRQGGVGEGRPGARRVL